MVRLCQGCLLTYYIYIYWVLYIIKCYYIIIQERGIPINRSVEWNGILEHREVWNSGRRQTQDVTIWENIIWDEQHPNGMTVGIQRIPTYDMV